MPPASGIRRDAKAHISPKIREDRNFWKSNPINVPLLVDYYSYLFIDFLYYDISFTNDYTIQAVVIS